MTIILTGTTGNLGSIVLRHLLTLLPPSEIIVSVYNPSSSSHDEIKKKGVQVRAGDYTKPETLEEAYRGGDKLFLVSSPSFDDEVRVTSHVNAINAAKKVGVKHVYYTSLAFFDPKNPDRSSAVVEQAHLRTEAALKVSGLTYTIIREGVYIEAYPVFLGFFNNKDREVVLPGDGDVAWIDREDLGAANAKLLVSEGYENKTVLLSGPRAVTLKHTTELISSFLGREIKFVKVTGEEWLQRHSDKGAFVKFWLSSYPAIEQGETSVVSNEVEKLLGRPPRPFEATLKELVLHAEKADSELSNWVKAGEGK